MGTISKGAIVGAIALMGCLSIAPMQASAMPVAGITADAAEPGVALGAGVEQVYWRRYGWRRPFVRYGWRRPYGWGWRHPYRRLYRW